MKRELTQDGGEEAVQKLGGDGAHGDEVGQKEAEIHGDEGGREDGREEEMAENHDDHAQEADSAVLDAHLVRNDVHEAHNDGLGYPCPTCVRDGMRRFPRHSSS